MKKFLRGCGIAAIVLVIISLITVFVVWSGGLFDDGRQPLNVNIQENDSPFGVQDRQEDTRDWIEERLNEAPRPDFRDNLQLPPSIEYDDTEPP